jgi:hypothetical protein
MVAMIGVGGAKSESKALLINSLAIIFAVLSTVSVLARVYTRTRILTILGADDITICIAQVLAIGVSVITVLGKWLFVVLAY